MSFCQKAKACSAESGFVSIERSVVALVRLVEDVDLVDRREARLVFRSPSSVLRRLSVLCTLSQATPDYHRPKKVSRVHELTSDARDTEIEMSPNPLYLSKIRAI